MTAGSCPSPGPSRALAVGVIGCGRAASQSMRCPLAYHLPQAANASSVWVLCPFLEAPICSGTEIEVEHDDATEGLGRG